MCEEVGLQNKTELSAAICDIKMLRQSRLIEDSPEGF